MKKFDELITEINSARLKRVQFRGGGATTSPISNQMVKGSLIGWFSTKQNPAFGFNIHSLEREDVKWLKSMKVDVSDLYRIVTDKNTTIVKLNLGKGTVAFADNKHLEDTDEFKLEKATPYSKLFVDWGKEKEFGIK